MPKSSEISTILQISDLHILPATGDKILGIDTEYYFQKTLQHAVAGRKHIDLILLTGDLTQTPSLPSYQRIRNELQKYTTRSVCLPGNHDDYQMMQTIFNSENSSCEKQILFGHWQIICLNSQKPGSESGYISDSELSFLETCLKNNPEKWTFIALHHHCLSINSAWLDTMIVENNDALFQLLKQYPKAKTMINGHIHQAITLQKDHLQLYGTPSTCFQFKPKNNDFALERAMPGYRYFDLYQDGRFTSDLVRLPGKLTDLEIKSQGY